jgi:hypothetical protein
LQAPITLIHKDDIDKGNHGELNLTLGVNLNGTALKVQQLMVQLGQCSTEILPVCNAQGLGINFAS